MSTSRLPTASDAKPAPAGDDMLFPTETEIYLLPDGRIVVADLPAELADAIASLGTVEPCDVIAAGDAPPAQS